MKPAILFLILLLTAACAFAQPVISVYPDELNFSPTPLNETSDLILTISNIGDAPLHIPIIRTMDDFVADPGNADLQPGEVMEVVVSFTPREEGERLGTLRIMCTDPQHEDFSLHLKGWGGQWAVEFTHDNNNASGAYDGSADQCEAVCFSPAHPCSLVSFRFRPRGTGRLECHVWGDNGAHQPDIENDLIEPFNVEVQSDRDWITVETSEYGLVIDPPQDFHIGFKLLGATTSLWLDQATPIQERSHLYAFDENSNQWMWYIFGGDHCNFMLRATVQYLSVAPSFTFRNVSQNAGVGGIGKAAWGDYNNDGWEDLLVNGCVLYRNDRDGTFTNVSAEAGIVADNPAHTGAWGDFNNDGWLDFISLLGGNSDDRLYRSNRDGTFECVNDYYSFHDENPTAAVGWGDCNNDGFLDFHIANSENWNDGNPVYFRDYFYRYNSDFEVFMNQTPEDVSRRFYYGRSVAWCDFNMDGWMDYYLSNYRLQPNFLLVNQGDGSFRDEADARGSLQGYNEMNAYGHTIGSVWADFDNDLDFDLLVGNFAHPWGLAYQDKIMLMRNDGAESEYTFTDIFQQSGIKYCETVFCPAFADYDNDGLQDVFISSVYDGRQPFMYRNLDGATFENVNYETGFMGQCYNSYGVSWCDYDHDGDLDVAIGNGGLYENTSQHLFGNNWAQFVLKGTSATVNKFAFGSKAFVYCGDRYYLRQVEGGSGAESCQNAATLHFGLGEADVIDSLVVDWIGGGVETYYDLPVNHRYEVIEGEGILGAPDRSEEVSQPLAFRLEGVYPNPFNSEVRIDFVLPSAGRVQLKVYDLSGREVWTVMDGMDSAGRHSLLWQAEDATAGVYFLRFEAGSYQQTRKITLLK